jgi:hypothetical protein
VPAGVAAGLAQRVLAAAEHGGCGMDFLFTVLFWALRIGAFLAIWGIGFAMGRRNGIERERARWELRFGLMFAEANEKIRFYDQFYRHTEPRE